MDRKDVYLSFIFIGVLTFSATKNYMILKNKINLLENNLSNIKERLSDLELFKLIPSGSNIPILSISILLCK